MPSKRSLCGVAQAMYRIMSPHVYTARTDLLRMAVRRMRKSKKNMVPRLRKQRHEVYRDLLAVHERAKELYEHVNAVPKGRGW